MLQFRHLRDQCKFPWLLANVLDPALGDDQALGGCPKTVIITASNGIKIGVIGLAEREWWVQGYPKKWLLADFRRLDTINSLPPNLIYQSASATAKKLVPPLRAQGAEIIVALTHQREPNDNKLAEKTPPGLIDIILGGHDHFYGHSVINGTHVLRSGTDFKQLSYIEARRRKTSDTPKWDFKIVRRDIVSSVPEDPETAQLVDKLTSSLTAKLEKPVGYAAVPLDARFTTVRTKESNMGNFVCDLMRHFYNTDCALMAAGTIRGDQIYPPGVIRLKDILNCFPFEDPVVVLRVTGEAILGALENSVCLHPALEGRFPQVSDIKFGFDPSRPSGSRVMWVKIKGEDLVLTRKYTLATRGFMTRGKDGYDALLAESEGGTAEEVVSEENGVLISTVLRQYFMSLKVLGKWARWSPSLHRHWGSVHEGLHTDGKVKKPARVKTGLKRKHTGEEQSVNGEKTDVDGHLIDSDTDEESTQDRLRDEQLQSHSSSASKSVLALSQNIRLEGKDRRMHLARLYVRRWMARAGIERHKAGVTEEEHSDDWVLPHWTHGIAPKLENRIVNVLTEKNGEENGQVN